MNHIVKPGQLLSGRYQLTELSPDQPVQDQAELWLAQDKLLSKPVRILVLDPHSPVKQATLDAARRSALVDDDNLVRVLSVGDTAEAAFITVEVPDGQLLSEYFDQDLSGEQVWCVLGTVAKTLESAHSQGLRHFQISSDYIWISPTGKIAVDGIGIAAALGGASASELPDPKADRLEAHRLLGFTAGLLTGQMPEDPDDTQDTLDEALERKDLPEPLRVVLTQERDGKGASAPSGILRGLGTWPAFQVPTPLSPAGESNWPHRKSAFGMERYSRSQYNEGADDVPSVTKFPKITAPLGGDAASSQSDPLDDGRGADAPSTASPAPVGQWGAPQNATPDEPEDDAQPPATGATAVFAKIVDPSDSDDEGDQHYARAASAGFAADIASEREATEQEEALARQEAEARGETVSSASPEGPEVDPSPSAVIDAELGIDHDADPNLQPQWIKPEDFASENAAAESRMREAIGPAESEVEPEDEPNAESPDGPAEPADATPDSAPESAPLSSEPEFTGAAAEPVNAQEPTSTRPESEPANEPFSASPEAQSAGATPVQEPQPEKSPAEQAPEPVSADADDSPTVVSPAAEEPAPNWPAVTPSPASPSPGPASPSQSSAETTVTRKSAWPVPSEPEVTRFDLTGGSAPVVSSSGAAEPPATPDPPATPAQPAAAARPYGSTPAAAAQRSESASSGDEKHYNPAKVFTWGTALLVVLAFVWAAVTFFRPTDQPDTSAPAPAPTQTQEATQPAETSSPEPTKEPTKKPDLPKPSISDVALLNPQAAALDPSNVGEQDSPATIPNAFDGNADTAWRSWWYSNPDFVGKAGLGLEISLEKETEVSEVSLAVNGSGGNVQWRDTSADEADQGDVVAEGSMSGETNLKAKKDDPIKTDKIVLWFNQLPTDDEGNYRISVSEITVK